MSDQADEAYRRLALEMVGGNSGMGPIRLKIISGSMAPMLRPGDIVKVRPLKPKESLQRGDIIVFQQSDANDPDLPLTHRLIGRSSAGWLTKGDSRLLPDALMLPQAILGKVIAYQRGQRWVDLETPVWRYLNRTLGWIHFWIGLWMSWANRARKLLGQR